MRLALSILALTSSACAGAPARTSLAAQPIRSACPAASHPAASVGVDVRVGRRLSTSRTIYVTNLSGAARDVSVVRVTRLEGECSRDWVRGRVLAVTDATTKAAPVPGTLASDHWMELKLEEQRWDVGDDGPEWDCVKLGVAVWLTVDGEEVCADAGAWIARAGDDDDDASP